MKRLLFAFFLSCAVSLVSLEGPTDQGRAGWTDFGLAFKVADAQGRGGGGRRGGGARRAPSRSAQSSMRGKSSHRASTRPARPSGGQRPSSGNRPSGGGQRPGGGKRPSRGDTNVNVNKNVNVDVDRRHGRGYAGAVVAGAVIAGAFIATLPTGCNSIYINGIRYYDCNSIYYVQSYQGTNVVYEAVDAPQ